MAISKRIPEESKLPLIVYRLSTYLIALCISVALFAILPVGSFLGYVWEWTLWLFLYGCIFGGIISGLSAFSNESTLREFVIFLLVAGICFFLHRLVLPYYEYVTTCSRWFYDSVWKIYYDYQVWFYAWVPLMFVVGCGCVAWPTLFVARFLDHLPRIIYGKAHCPHVHCDYIGNIAVQCPHCGTIIPNLTPTRYGVFTTPCPHCERKLVTGWQWGKNAYSRHCPQCLKDWNILGLGRSITRRVILTGASQSGKTSFLTRSIMEMNRFYPDHILYTTVDQQTTLQNMFYDSTHSRYVRRMRQIDRPAGVPVLFQTSPRETLTYFYDSTGSEFQSGTTNHLFYDNADGIVLLVDPFAEPGVLDYLNITPEHLPRDFNVAKQRADEIAGNLCVILEKITGTAPDSCFSIPLCVVLTKTDMFDLYERIDPEIFSLGNWEDHSQKTQEFLQNCGLSNFLGILESRFSDTMFFASSAFLEYAPEERIYNPAILPMLWMMRHLKGF